MEGLKNLMEETVEDTLNRVLPTMPNVCSCPECRLDMAAYALNRLKPKYARTIKGAILHRFDTSSTQIEAAILSTVVSAINVISAHPNHTVENSSGNSSL